MKIHLYKTRVEWTGNTGTGTSAYDAYSRQHNLIVGDKPIVTMSSDPAFRGDPMLHNPEELLVAAISSCHMLWYLHLCAENGITVTDYTDEAEGEMHERKDGSGKFSKIMLRPRVTISNAGQLNKASLLHHRAHEMCFIANSVNFEVACHPVIHI